MRRPDCSAASVTSLVAQEAREVGDRARACPRRARRTRPAVPRRPCRGVDAERLRQHGEVEPGVGREPDLVAAACCGQLGRRPERGEPAAGDDRDAVAQLLGFVHRVRREQHGDAAVAQVAHELPRRRAACGSMPAVGSSRNTTSGRPIERAREREALGLAAREPPHRRARSRRAARRGRAAPRATRGSS